jgi:MFS family permease
MGAVFYALRDHPTPSQDLFVDSTKDEVRIGARIGIYILVTSGRYGVLRVLGTFIPVYVTDIFLSDFRLASGILSVFNLIGVVATLVSGVFTDTRGRKPLLLLSNGCSLFPMLLAILSPTIEMFTVAIMLLGVTFFIGQAADAVYLTEVAPTTTQGRIFGLILSMQMVAAAFSSLFFGFLGDLWGLQTGLILLTGLLLTATLGSIFLHDLPIQQPK